MRARLAGALALEEPGAAAGTRAPRARDLGTHSLSALLGAGLAPHVLVGADPGDLTRHWNGLDLSGVGAFAIAATFAAPVRRRFTFAGNGLLDSWIFAPLGETPALSTGGSVACSMFSLAVHLGCDPIVLVGQDLSFTERFYAAENLDGDARVEHQADGGFRLIKPAGASGIGVPLADGRLEFVPTQQQLEVDGWAGGRVRTTPQLKAFLDWFENVAPTMSGTSRLVNATEGGARIRGFEPMALREVSAAWSAPLEVEAVLTRACEGLDVSARRRTLATWAERTLRSLEDCTRLARQCRALSASSSLQDLRRAEKKLSASLRQAPLVSLVAQDEIARAKESARTAAALDQNLDAARRLYALVERAGALLTEPLRAAWRALA